MLRLELTDLQDRYVAALDNDRIEEWPGFFVDDCLYEIVSKENEDAGFPAPVMHCDNIRMVRDRVVALRNANIYEKPQYRHCLSGLEWSQAEDGSIAASDQLRGGEHLGGRAPPAYTRPGATWTGSCALRRAWRFKAKRCIYDTLRVQTLLAFPI